jgi:hypothetical protein
VHFAVRSRGTEFFRRLPFEMLRHIRRPRRRLWASALAQPDRPPICSRAHLSIGQRKAGQGRTGPLGSRHSAPSAPAIAGQQELHSTAANDGGAYVEEANHTARRGGSICMHRYQLVLTSSRQLPAAHGIGGVGGGQNAGIGIGGGRAEV